MIQWLQQIIHRINIQVVILMKQSGTKNNGRNVSFSRCSETEDHPLLALSGFGLIRVLNHRRIKEGCWFNEIFHGKTGADQYSSWIIESLWINIQLFKQVLDAVKMLLKDLRNIPVSHRVIPQGMFQCKRSSLLGHIKNSAYGVYSPLFACKKKTGNDSTGFRVKYDIFSFYGSLHLIFFIHWR